MPSVPARDPKKMRTGFTTGACATAAAQAATRLLVRGAVGSSIDSVLPNRKTVRFALHRAERQGPQAVCSVIKDAGDDPDCTHGAELVATVALTDAPGVHIVGGAGVATVTKPGLGLEVGGPAVNPVPRRTITEAVLAELTGADAAGATVVLSVPGGEEMAKETLNARLGLHGGISILGTSGIVRPYSTAAFRASIIQSIDVAHERGHRHLVVTTGGKSELYAMRLFSGLGEEAFIQMGDFVGSTLRHCARRGIGRVSIVGMIGKLSKMADGKMQTHAAGSEVNMALLATLAAEAGGGPDLTDEIGRANTARHVLELCGRAGLSHVTTLICKRVVDNAARHIQHKVPIDAALVDFGGSLLGQYPEEIAC
jgi:cobalt-precorrin-5B (C1)-methyltransferase